MRSFAELNKRADALISASCAVETQDVYKVGDELTLICGGQELTYKPSKTGQAFHADDSKVRAVMGPVGSGKSTMCCMEMLKQAMAIPKCKDGKRRFKGAIIRNTYPELKTTTLETFLYWLKDFGHHPTLNQSSPITYRTVFNDGEGDVEFIVLFLALDRAEDIKKLMSLEVSGAFINEARYIDETVLNALGERLRYPNRAALTEDYKYRIILDTNPPDTDSWWYRRFEIDNNDNETLFRQPGGLIKTEYGYEENPEAENLSILAKNYYTENARGRPESEIRVQLMGLYGAYSQGDRIFTSYNDDVHSKDQLSFDPSLNILVGFDFGLTPSAVFAQQTPRGQLKIIKEFCSTDMFLEAFLDNVVLPFINLNLRDCKITAVGDPSGVNRETKGNTAIGVINEKGITAVPAPTNAIDRRIGAVDKYLNRMIDGMPGIIVSRTGCPTIRKGFNEKYQWKVINGQKFPDKNEYSHSMDALQYICLQIAEGIPLENLPEPSYAGWV